MSSISPPRLTVYSPPPEARHRTMAAVLDAIAAALDGDGATVAPHSIDSAGLSLWVDGMALRLELTEEAPEAPAEAEAGEEDAAEWYRLNRERFERFMAEGRRDEAADAKYMRDTDPSYAPHAEYLRAEDARRNAAEDGADARDWMSDVSSIDF
jgi:hypothetical protein